MLRPEDYPLPPPSFFQTAWLVLLCLLAASAVLFALRLRRVAERMAERERAARELYDNLLQNVGGLILRFHTATERIPQSDPTKELLEEALRQSDELLQRGREWASASGATSTDADELAQAFAAVGQELRQEHPADFRVVVNGDPRQLHPMVRDEIYRIGREAIANSFQHAKAERCETEIYFDRAQLRIGFRDDGCGVDSMVLKAGTQAGHPGVAGMYERARGMGALLEIWTRPGVGTEVELRVPAAIAYRSIDIASRWQWLRRLASGGGS